MALTIIWSLVSSDPSDIKRKDELTGYLSTGKLGKRDWYAFLRIRCCVGTMLLANSNGTGTTTIVPLKVPVIEVG
jgi:hypothetical protein